VVGTAGILPTPSDAPGNPPSLKNVPITILPGFPTTLASGEAQDLTMGHPVSFPFGIWFADASTLYVCDEGDGTLVSGQVINGTTNVADAATLAAAGVQKWKLINGMWKLQYILQDGLSLGVPYGVANYPASLNPATDGCRNLTGQRNGDGTVTIYAVTSTVSTNGDQGADPNKLVKVTDLLKAISRPTRSGDRDKDGTMTMSGDISQPSVLLRLARFFAASRLPRGTNTMAIRMTNRGRTTSRIATSLI
jgi:hypothetical protein